MLYSLNLFLTVILYFQVRRVADYHKEGRWEEGEEERKRNKKKARESKKGM
jgi:hypothetical protein